MRPLGGMIREEGCRRPWLHDFDRPPTFTRQQAQAHIDDAQEGPGEDPARGVDRWHGLRDEEPWPTRGEGRQGREQPLEEERGLLLGDILIEEGGQGLQEDHQPDRMGGEERVEAVAEQRGQLPAGEGAHEVDAPEEDRWRDAAGLSHGDDWRDVKGHGGIDHSHLPPPGQRACSRAQGYPLDATIPPDEERAPLWRDGRRGS
jgi:hypothetical protein